MGEVIYGVVFGKPKEPVPLADLALGPDGKMKLDTIPPHLHWYFSDDVQLPSDTEPPNEPA